MSTKAAAIFALCAFVFSTAAMIFAGSHMTTTPETAARIAARDRVTECDKAFAAGRALDAYRGVGGWWHSGPTQEQMDNCTGENNSPFKR